MVQGEVTPCKQCEFRGLENLENMVFRCRRPLKGGALLGSKT
jgi:hypothetical protein